MGAFVAGNVVVAPFPFDDYAVSLIDDVFDTGGLRQPSNIRPNRLFTADTKIILFRAGKISNAKMREVRAQLMMILAG